MRRRIMLFGERKEILMGAPEPTDFVFRLDLYFDRGNRVRSKGKLTH